MPLTGPHLFPDSQLQILSLDPRPRVPEVLVQVLLVSRCVRYKVFFSSQEHHRLLPYTENDALLAKRSHYLCPAQTPVPVLHGNPSPVQLLGVCQVSSSLIQSEDASIHCPLRVTIFTRIILTCISTSISMSAGLSFLSGGLHIIQAESFWFFPLAHNT